jgi:hypothetical protein
MITERSGGIHPPYEAFYLQSIYYAADRCIESFERYDAHRESGKPGVDQVSSVHEALGHAGSVSRFFWPSGLGGGRSQQLKELAAARAKLLRESYEISDDSPLKDRHLRDSLEHFDERLDKYLLTSTAGQYMPVPRVGDSTNRAAHEHIFKLLDPERDTFVILDEAFHFASLRHEVTRVLLKSRELIQTTGRLVRR